jgi:hypothetical protein
MESHKTAIKRNKPSSPMQYLSNKGLLVGNKLDYGCGQGFDADHYNMSKFDPYYAKTMPEGQFDTITCNYVLNVIQNDETIISVINTIKSKLSDNGIAYITVRNDIKRDGPTIKGYQRNINLEHFVAHNLQLIKTCAAYRMYKLTK